MPKSKFFIHLIIASLIFMSAVFLRTFALDKQGLLHYDEGKMIFRSAELVNFLLHGANDGTLKPSYVDSKMLWLLLIALGERLLQMGPLSAQCVSALFGLLTIILVYRFSQEIYHDRAISLLSMIFLSFSFLHVIYSRMALPEAASTFFALLSIYLCRLAMERGKIFAALGGVSLAFAFLTNRFRVILFLIYILLFIQNFSKGKRSISTYCVFLCGVFLPVISYAFMIPVLNGHGFGLEPLWTNIHRHLDWHSEVTFEPAALLAFFYYLFRFEGMGILLLLAASIFFIKHKYPTYPFVVFVILQMLLASLIDEKVPRAVSAVLPFVAVTCAVTLCNIFQMMKTPRLRQYFVFGSVVILGTGFVHSSEALRSRSHISEAVQWIKEDMAYKGGILSTNKAVTTIYAKNTLVGQLDARIRGYYVRGYDYMIVEPTQYTLGNYTGYWKRDTNRTLYPAIQAYCTPLKEYRHFNKTLLDFYLFEHTRPSFQRMHEFIKSLKDDSGRLYVYKIGPCLRAMENHWDDPFLNNPWERSDLFN